MIEFILGVAVVLLAGYFSARHRDRIRSLANGTILGITAGRALPDIPDTLHDHHGHDGGSHPSGPHWEDGGSMDHTDSIQ
jgi:hypothetical protein